MKVRPPQSEEELIRSAAGIAGLTLSELATRQGLRVPEDQRRAKGWVGSLIEACLGATAGSRPVPDFERIGVELKTLPIGKNHTPTESTYVCSAQLTDLADITWENSRVKKKLTRVLWVPVQGGRDLPMAERRVGTALLWSATAEDESVLRADWQELTDMIRMGQVELIDARRGEFLQIRPKGRNAKDRCWGIDENGHRFLTLPRGYYLRARFTAGLLRRNYALPR